jgi:hypothetical protein
MMKNVFNRLCYAKHDARRAVSKAGLSGICLCLFAVSASADPVILFDDLYGPTSSVARIPPGYHGLAWNGLDVLNGVDFIFNPSGYQAGVVSPKNVVYPINGDIYTSQNGSIAGGLFDLLSAYMTATLNDDLNVQVLGYIGGTLIYSNNYVLNATTPTLIQFNYYGVDEVDFITSGGLPHGGYGPGFDEGFAMDNVNVTVYAPYQSLQNGDFETGDFTGWSLFGETNFCDVTTNAAYIYSGVYGARLGPSGGLGELSQSISTGTTASYDLSFWLDNFGSTGNEFAASWEGGTLFDNTNVSTFGWVNPEFKVTSFKPKSTLQFGFQNNPSYFGLDEIRLTPTPLLQNGSFESGFASWTLSGNTNFLVISQQSAYARTGTQGAAFGSVGSPGYISQTLNTYPGQLYLVSFWLGAVGTNTPNNEFIASWDGQTLFDATNLPATGWTNLHFSVLASGYESTLKFGGRNDPAYFALDEITVIPVPLVNNGGFETGDFSGWTPSGNFHNFGCYVTTDTSFVASGSYGAELGPVGALGYLSQSIPTIPEQTYLLSFWYHNPSGRTPNDFQVNWDGATLLDLTNWVHTNWLNPQFLVTAATTNTTLQFGFLDGPAYVGLDEVTVQPFPPPEFISQLVSAGSLDLTFATVPGFEYQVQYSLDLKTWNDLGAARYAASIAMTASDPIGADSHRFYRVILLQPIHIF